MQLDQQKPYLGVPSRLPWVAPSCDNLVTTTTGGGGTPTRAVALRQDGPSKTGPRDATTSYPSESTTSARQCASVSTATAPATGSGPGTRTGYSARPDDKTTQTTGMLRRAVAGRRSTPAAHDGRAGARRQ